MDDAWRKPSAELVEQFHLLAAGIEGVELRKMFGYPAAFVNGNLAFGLYQETFMVRLPEDAREERLAAGWSRFEPMAGRPMREYVALPPEVAADDHAARTWFEQSARFVASLPPKEPKPRKRR
jgi:TfoX/Sxy family transcriptional regulator of competence genes